MKNRPPVHDGRLSKPLFLVVLQRQLQLLNGRVTFLQRRLAVAAKVVVRLLQVLFAFSSAWMALRMAGCRS